MADIEKRVLLLQEEHMVPNFTFTTSANATAPTLTAHSIHQYGSARLEEEGLVPNRENYVEPMPTGAPSALSGGLSHGLPQFP